MRKAATPDTLDVDLTDKSIISKKIAAINSEVRFSIIEILRGNVKNEDSTNKLYQKRPLYSRQINKILKDDYNIVIAPQMLGQHLKKLLEADLIEQEIIRIEVENRPGLRPVKAYKLKKDAFKELFLDIAFFSDELFTYFDLYNRNLEKKDGEHCVLTIFNGVNKGDTYVVNKDETVLIGREENFDVSDIASFTIQLDKSYKSVSRVSKPHLKIFNKNDEWYIEDTSSTNGTYILDKQISRRKPDKLKNNTFLKLSKGRGSAVIYCSFQ